MTNKALESCPYCKSTRLAKFRLDADWGNGGDFGAYHLNDHYEPMKEAGYTKSDLDAFEDNERPDIECLYCCNCLCCFEPRTGDNK